MAAGGTFRKFRIFVLLAVLAFVGADAWLTRMRTTDWDRPLWVVIYPVNGDGSDISQSYIRNLTVEAFHPIARFMRRELQRFGRTLNSPVKFKLHPEVPELPPAPPSDGNVLKIVWWSLELRYWANRVDRVDDDLPEDIRMFVLYHDPATHDRLEHSLGLEEGLIGIVNAYASRGFDARNNVVVAHELLHTVGATDKYDPGSGIPLFPDGYAEPARDPLYPQTHAEIMGGRIPLSEHTAEMPAGLNFARVGAATAREIGWVD